MSDQSTHGQWVQERIDELYLLEKRAQERQENFEENLNRQLDAIGYHQKRLDASIDYQDKLDGRLEHKLSLLEKTYGRAANYGILTIGIIVLGLLGVFLLWRHADQTLDKASRLNKKIDAFYDSLTMVQKPDGVYFRIQPSSVTSDLRGDDGNRMSGTYAKLHYG